MARARRNRTNYKTVWLSHDVTLLWFLEIRDKKRLAVFAEKRLNA